MSQPARSMIRQVALTLKLSIVFAVLLILSSVTHSRPLPRKISIGEARSLPLGTIVTVQGSVTVPSGAFSSSTFDQGFAIQDRTGGIYVSVPTMQGSHRGKRFASPVGWPTVCSRVYSYSSMSPTWMSTVSGRM